MDIVQQMLKRLEKVTFLATGNASVLIGLGEELGLTPELRQMSVFDDTDMGGVSIGAIAGQIQVLNMTSFKLVEEQWVFKPSGWDNTVYYLAGDWWPILAYLRLEALVRKISTTYAGLDLTEHLTLTKHLQWGQATISAYDGRFNVSTHDVTYWIRHGLHHKYFGTVRDDGITSLGFDENYWKPNDLRWLSVIRALIQRFENLEVTIPPA